MNDTRDQIVGCAGKQGSCACRCGGAKSRRGGAMVAIYAGVFTALFSAGVVGKGKKSVEAPPPPPPAPEVPAAAAAGAGGGGGGATGGAGESAADARERMEVDGSKMVKMSLLFSDGADMGEQNRVGTFAVVFEVEKGWHTYWRNAGDSGMPPSFEFTVEPKGMLEVGAPCWPLPKRHISDGDILDYIHEGRVAHLFEVKRGSAWRPDVDIKVVCKASWLVCKEACLPGDGQSEIVIRSSAPQAKAVDEAGEEISWFGYPCGPLNLDLKTQEQVTWRGTTLEISPTHENVSRLTFFPFAEEGDVTPINILTDGEVKSDGGHRPRLILRFAEDDLRRGKHVRGVLEIEPLKDSVSDGFRPFSTAYTLDIPTPRPTE